MGPIDYTRHVALVASAMLALAATLWVWPVFVVPKLGLYGALHAVAIAGALRGRASLLARSVFVAVASGLSVTALYAGVYGARILEQTAGAPTFLTTLGLASALGAVGYGLLLRSLWLPQLSLPALGGIASGCLASTLLAVTGFAHTHWLPEAVTVMWWVSFSAGLWTCGRFTQHTARIHFRPGL